MKPRIEVILFDLGGVLMDFRGLPRLAELTDRDNDAALGKQWSQSRWLRKFETGRCTATEFAAGVVGEWGLRLTPVAFLSEFSRWPTGPFDGATELVRDLHGRIPMGCLSNTNPVHWRAHLDRWGLVRHFDWKFVSHELGMMKPDPELFEHVLAETGVAADRLLFLDDCEEHVVAARAHGIRGELARGLEQAKASIVEYAPQVLASPCG